MKKENAIIAGVFILLLLAVLGLGAYFYSRNEDFRALFRKDTAPDIVEFPDNPQKGDPGYQEKNTVIIPDDNSNKMTTFLGTEGDLIIVNESGMINKYQMGEEIALNCTSQDLNNFSEDVDLSQVVAVKIVGPDEIGTTIPANEPVFMQISGTVHTIVLAEEICK